MNYNLSEIINEVFNTKRKISRDNVVIILQPISRLMERKSGERGISRKKALVESRISNKREFATIRVNYKSILARKGTFNLKMKYNRGRVLKLPKLQ